MAQKEAIFPAGVKTKRRVLCGAKYGGLCGAELGALEYRVRIASVGGGFEREKKMKIVVVRIVGGCILKE